jgi:hypothetical protein
MHGHLNVFLPFLGINPRILIGVINTLRHGGVEDFGAASHCRMLPNHCYLSNMCTRTAKMFN